MFAVLFWSSCNSAFILQRLKRESRDTICFIKPKFKTLRSILAFSLLFGTLFVPLKVEANFFSSLFGDQVYADAKATPLQPSSDNSQTLALLQANVSSASDDTNANTDNISGNALSPKTGPAGVSGEQDAIDSSCAEPDIYVVVDGDSISKVAKLLGVTEDTVLAANGMKKKLVKDDVLFIPPISGVIHTVAKGQTLQSIAKFYKANINDIAFCNGITPNAKLAINDELMIPGAEMPVPSVAPKPSSNQPQYYEVYPAQNLAGFIDPVPGYRLSQGLHDGNAVDLAIAKGTPIHAAASGRVIFAKAGRNGGFGWLVIIAHPDSDTQTMYAHMSKIIVHAGDQVVQGQVIGNVGSTGHSTGSHLHFVVKGAFNPGVNGSWAN